MKNHRRSPNTHHGLMLLAAGAAAAAAYWGEHLRVQSTLADYGDHKLIVATVVFVVVAVVLHVLMPDAPG